jgi:hypothetical protein
VNAMRRRPEIGQRNRGSYRESQHPPRGLAVFFWEVSAPKSGSQFGEPGESAIRPAIASEFGEADVRPATGVTGAPLPHHQQQFRSRSGRLHPHQATREHRGELQPRAGRERGLHCGEVWPAMAPYRSRGNYVRSGEVWPASAPYRSRSRGGLRQACRVAVPLTETYRDLPRTAPLAPGQGDRGLKIYRSASV